MKTNYWTVDIDVDIKNIYPQVVEAAHYLKEGEVVAFPTETVYGLGANALTDKAVAKIFDAKGRPADNPLIVHIANVDQLDLLTKEIPETTIKLMDEFWPGPLTLIFKRKPNAVSSLVTAGLDTVAVRMPDHPVALALIHTAGVPIAAPSANKSGKPSPTMATHVLADLEGLIAGIVDGGPTGVGLESTVLDCTPEVPVILRPGGLSKEEIERVIGQVDQDPALQHSESSPKSPGMKYRHYAPSAPLFLADGDKEWIQELIDQKRNSGTKVGVLAPKESASFYNADVVAVCGSRSNLKSVAHTLYQALRSFDEKNLDMIYAEVYPVQGVGAAIMNRLEKAAAHRRVTQGKTEK
ncbi:threonylcarbamoyl-AMP synthase [Siminovitchia terrae]|uniref:Threonylcarbamoyl-AMP synthase n=1 Tax=Siminovitchia terrae TaxID=1914933 RepID=A0A429XBZ2_SIMTE|nr:L-threonylcarbamoyladenylate synthase [Siminovitchia terrae]RST60977.1 threonylcarbamoyl-AMP synthase [Siminovitchia terrae]GIN90837.1 threonylcarbamoyl-AMP synthase [Siminovitchia terrae]GIN97613.1 threonylcarbamoyl-AMP synthase [Siminovitchia terrae]